jgi:hypothetical protein
MDGAIMDTERRLAPRYECAGDAELVVPGRGLRYPGQVVDLSTGGCFIETACRLERGTSVEIWMTPQGEPLRIGAHLVVRRENGVGCRFHELTARKLRQVEWLIEKLAAESAADRAADRAAGGVSEPPGERGGGPIVVRRCC